MHPRPGAGTTGGRPRGGYLWRMTPPIFDAADPPLQARFDGAQPFTEFLASATENVAQWRDTYRLAKVPEEAIARVAALPGRYYLLVLSEDWCGDAINTVPLLARFADAAPNLELRVLARDANPDLMDAHLTGASRSIPVVMVLDERFAEHGWWGPRPRELQAWVLGPGQALEKTERYRQVRTWYARDRGRSTLAEVSEIIERAAGEGRRWDRAAEG